MPDPHRPRKRFGQHFLHDAGVVHRIVDAIAPRAGDTLVEIGPGTGALTAPLLDAVDTLHAIEIDRDLAARLEERFAGRGLVLHVADALRFDYAGLARGAGATTRLRVVGNLPYNVSTPLLFRLLDHRAWIRDMHFMLQREVVERLAAAPGSHAYGRLGVMVQLHCEVEMLFRVGAGAFRPPPKVESAVVRLVPRRRLALADDELEAFAGIVTRLFGQRRKTLRNGLRGVLDADAIARAGVDPALRPETLAVADFAALARAWLRRSARDPSCG